MLRHLGPKRTFAHNIRLAGLLSFAAGVVNVAGFLAFAVLTTNVTGHVALFSEKISEGDLYSVSIIAGWMLLFLFGSFLTSYIIGAFGETQRYSYTLPILLELLILETVAWLGIYRADMVQHRMIFAGILLFAMGLQNAVVSLISGSVVRTTHLTGMFTDLGIELAHIMKSEGEARQQLSQKITLRLVIIGSFITGGIMGGYMFHQYHFPAFHIPAVILIFALFYDIFRLTTLKAIRGVRGVLKSQTKGIDH
jgi:uncharacterized membrane protein YoaK (UPF0700 family)